MKNWDTSYSEEHFTTNVKAVPKASSDDSEEAYYLCEVLEDEKETYKIDNTDIVLDISQKYNNNFREALPSFAIIREVFGKDPDFEVGDYVVCNHFAFVGQDRIAKPFKKDENGVELYRVSNKQIKTSLLLEGGIKTPRTGVIVGLPIKDKLLKTEHIILTSNDIDYRRDITKVIKAWKGCDLDVKEGEYLILDEGGDYIFTWNKKDYIAVDLEMEGAVAIVDDVNWKNYEAKRHLKDHNDLGYQN